jgi:hypothetical protein
MKSIITVVSQRSSQDIPVVVPELELGDMKRKIFGAA